MNHSIPCNPRCGQDATVCKLQAAGLLYADYGDRTHDCFNNMGEIL